MDLAVMPITIPPVCRCLRVVQLTGRLIRAFDNADMVVGHEVGFHRPGPFLEVTSVSIGMKEVTRAESVDLLTVLLDVRSAGDELIICRKAGPE